ncbi:hypothetical protein D9M68_925980 [compost metagenome]
MLQEPSCNGMTRFVVSNYFLLFRLNDLVFLFQATDDAVNGIIEVLHIYLCLAVTGSDQGSLITNIRDVCTRKTRCLDGQFLHIKVS